MLISKNNRGEVTGWRETYISDSEVVEVGGIGGPRSMVCRSYWEGNGG